MVGGYNDNLGAIAASPALQPVASLALGKGSWFAIPRLVVLGGGPLVKAICQLQVGNTIDQGRVVLDSSTNALRWLAMSATGQGSSARAKLACHQSGSYLEAAYLHVKILAIKAGSLTDKALD